MKKLLYKEMKLSANPLSYWFIAFSAMTMLPGYPILVSSFFICLGIFYTYQQVREYDDITYTVMLPVRKRDVVTAKYLFVLLIQGASFFLCAVLTMIRMTFLGDVAPYVTNQLMNANAAYLGYVLIVFAIFNSIFLVGFFRTTYKIGKPFITFCLISSIIITAGEILHHIPDLESLNDPSRIFALQLAILAVGIMIFILSTYLSYPRAVRSFEEIDL